MLLLIKEQPCIRIGGTELITAAGCRTLIAEGRSNHTEHLLLSSLDLDNTYMMLFDVDNFKSINDTYGHEAGDRALIKLVQILKSKFRSDDYVCRIGGDEFVVFMVHSTENQHDLIASKIGEINAALSATDDGLPPISISVGIVHGSEVAGAENLFEKADEAMYRSKQKGKHTYTFGEGS